MRRGLFGFGCFGGSGLVIQDDFALLKVGYPRFVRFVKVGREQGVVLAQDAVDVDVVGSVAAPERLAVNVRLSLALRRGGCGRAPRW